MATTILGSGNDSVKVSQGPLVKINLDPSAAWNNQIIDGAAGVDTLIVDGVPPRNPATFLFRCRMMTS